MFFFLLLFMFVVFVAVLVIVLCCKQIPHPGLCVCVSPTALRDNRIDLIRASWQELTISIREVTLGDEGLYTCSLFTMPVKTAKAYLTVLGKNYMQFTQI